jgi:aldose 1-epimerase
VNLTQHTYFDLSSGLSPHVLDHFLKIRSAHFTPTDAEQIPTGEIASVDGTPFDFRVPARIGARIDAPHEQLAIGRGYDHNWVLDEATLPAAHVLDPRTRRTLEIRTTEPGLQFYSGNLLDGTLIGFGGRRYVKHSGFCLETQHFPDSPHQPRFPTTRVNPGEVYRSRTTLTFGVE